MSQPIDIQSPEFTADPGPALARARADGPLAEIAMPLVGRMLATTDDATAREVLKDPRLLRDPEPATGKSLVRTYWWLPRFMAPLMHNMLAVDGEDHARLRRLVEDAFRRRAVERMRPRLEEMADGLLDAVDPAGAVDLVGAYARPLPLLAICELLGMPEADRRRVSRWIAPLSSPTGAVSFMRALPGLWRVMRHFRRDFETVRRTGRPGLIRDLVEARAEGDRLSDDELLAMVVTLFVAGHETTVHLIGDAVLALLDDPEGARRALSDPARLSLAIEEVLRFHSPVMMTKPLHAARDLEIGGRALRRGERVTALLVAANRDPARFEAPDECRLDRRPNAHLTFGYGPHVCLGMQLARLEAHVALSRLFARYPDLALAVPRDRVDMVRRAGIRGPAALPVRLAP